MDKTRGMITMNYEEKSLKELQSELKNIKTGREILNIKQSQIELEMAHKEEKARALVMQSSHLLEAQQEDSLEEQEWGEELQNIEEDRIQEEIML